jgi:ribosomal protein L18
MHAVQVEVVRPGIKRIYVTLLTAWLCMVCTVPLSRAGELNWNTNSSLVSADYSSTKLLPVLERVAASTGWRVYLEPDALSHQVSAKFKNLPPGEALRMLLGDLNFALVPNDGKQRLYVFRTAQRNATQLVKPQDADAKAGVSKKIGNELIVRLKPGMKIEDIAKLVGAKVTGRIDELNAYRLQFDDEEAANKARDLLASNSDVSSIEDNYVVDRPEVPVVTPATSGGLPNLQLKPPPDSGKVIIGLIDTPVQSLGSGLDKFLLESISLSGETQLNPSELTHGTSMLETMLKALETSTKGSTSVQILPVDVYGNNASTSTFDVAQGIAKAINAGANPINLSLGSPADSQFLRDLITEAYNKGILIFAAKGNEPVQTPVYPAAYNGVIAVTAIDQGQIAPYANRAAIPAVGAPGTGVVHFNGKAYIVSGTSVSTAFVSGLAAGYMEVNSKTATQTRDYIQGALGTSAGTSGKPAGASK